MKGTSQMTIPSSWATAFVVLVLLMTGAVAHAADYYVAQQHPQPSDSNPGTQGQPWMSRIRLLHRIDRKGPNGVDAQLLERLILCNHKDIKLKGYTQDLIGVNNGRVKK